MFNTRVNEAVGEESPDLVSFPRVVDEDRAEGGGSSPGDGDTKVGEIDAVIDVDGYLDNGEQDDEEGRRPPPVLISISSNSHVFQEVIPLYFLQLSAILLNQCKELIPINMFIIISISFLYQPPYLLPTMKYNQDMTNTHTFTYTLVSPDLLPTLLWLGS